MEVRLDTGSVGAGSLCESSLGASPVRAWRSFSALSSRLSAIGPTRQLSSAARRLFPTSGRGRGRRNVAALWLGRAVWRLFGTQTPHHTTPARNAIRSTRYKGQQDWDGEGGRMEVSRAGSGQPPPAPLISVVSCQSWILCSLESSHHASMLESHCPLHP